jgi:hypothetical protein
MLPVPSSPCTSCPYRRDTPAGVWAPEEYAKLPGYDTNERFELFLCHQGPLAKKQTVCRGWLSVHCESVAARLAVARGDIESDERYTPVAEPLYESGTEAAKAGLRAVRRPGRKAREVIARLVAARRKRRRKAN